MKTGSTEKWIVCRVCLQQPREVMETIFDHSEEKDLTRMILECGGVPIQRFDHYPDKICSKCLKYLRIAYKFRITCQRSYKHLSRFIAPVIVERTDGDFSDVALELEEVEEIAMKLEPDEVKQEYSENDDEVVDVYEPMEDCLETMEDSIESIVESPSPVLSGEVEYLEEFEEAISTSDEEFVPNARGTQKKAGRGRPGRPPMRKTAAKRAASKSTSASKKPGKRGPKPKRAKDQTFICDMCGNIYPSQGRLTEHIKLHKGIKPHECEICGHAFAQMQQLSRHMNTHTGNRPYKCIYCPAAFADLSTRNKHHRIHTNERPYVCDVCGKAFTYTNTLKFHKMIHTGEKPHVCDICGKGFQQAYKLRNHKMTHERRGAKLEKIEVEPMSNYHHQDVNVTAAQILEI